MTFKILSNDLKKNRMMNLLLVLFILLPAMMAGTAVSLIQQTVRSVDALFLRAEIPDYVQMHAGPVNREEVEEWSRENPLVRDFQIVEMINLDGSEILPGEEKESLAGSVMDLSLVTGNERFDRLLDLENRPVQLSDGEIGVPLFFMETRNLTLNDTLLIETEDYRKLFRIAAFVRDAQMNPALVHSKRFVLSPGDFQELRSREGIDEYLMEYLLKDPETSEDLADQYEKAGLPANGPAVTRDLFTLLNALTSGITVALLILVTLLFTLIALLCLRFSILAALEEDSREISVMKALGFPRRFVSHLYLGKYSLLAGIASLGGYALSFLLYPLLSEKIRLYLGEAPLSPGEKLLPLTGPISTFAVVLVFCLLLLRRFRNVSALTGLRGETGTTGRTATISLGSSRIGDINILLGARDLLHRFRLYWVIGTIFFASAFVILVPLNLVNTLDSPSFIRYMGIGECDIRIDLSYSEDRDRRFEEIQKILENDPEVLHYAPMKTGRYRIETSHGEKENLNVETGDFSAFPLEYQSGSAPDESGEIALSQLNARNLNARVGEELTLYSETGTRTMRISGIYQDITNGGLTAKAVDPPGTENTLWYVINISLRNPELTGPAKVREYSALFRPARVSLLEEYLSQTLGSVVTQLKRMSLTAAFSAILITAFITSLFLRLMILKDSGRIAIMRCLGFSSGQIRKQYFTGMMILILTGFVLGTAAANTAGEKLVGFIWSFLGASSISFEINTLGSYLFFPLMMILTVTGALVISTRNISQKNISAMNAE